MARRQAAPGDALCAVPGLRIVRGGRDRNRLSDQDAFNLARVSARLRSSELGDELGLRGMERRTHRYCAVNGALAFVAKRLGRGLSFGHVHQLTRWRVERYYDQVAVRVAAARRRA